MKHSTGTLPSSDGIHTLRWFAEIPEKPVCAMLIVHGMAEYKERYAYTMLSLAERGVACFCYDQLGHGQTADDESEKGFFAYKNGVEHIIYDVHGMLALIRESCPDKKLILLGHSMGSFIVRLYAATYNDIDMLVVSGTSGTNPGVGPGILLTDISCALRGDKFRSSFIDKIAMGGNSKHFKGEEYEAQAWLTHDIEIRCDMNEKSYIFTVSGMRDMFRLLDAVSKKSWYGRIPDSLPVYMFSGDEDPIGNYGKGFAEVVERLRADGVSVTARLYPGGRHEMLNETNRDEVTADLFEEITKVL